ncbi:hypothetical protein VMCG_08857 [Cytospora schulzeri]|uniref:NAD(P)-binding domain-containing protein n=1 Tax=Cytospora schulzeri TaxID=448051 RepID=A0A423VUL9_9PEZI|nr:hypothetical protein VMCG_08857 [Valsa malicola]
MSTSTVTTVLVTGANRGIGRALAEAYLSRPNHVVIGSVRNPETTTLRDFKPAEGSELLLVKAEATLTEDFSEAIEQVKTAGITSLDILIAVAGINPPRAFADVKDIDIAALREVFEINTFSFVSLLRATYPLLQASAEKNNGAGFPKLLALTSNGGQIVDMEPTIPVKIGVYGASKAALNYLVRRTHFENPWLTAWTMNPGFVQTDTGNACAKAWGMGMAPHALEDIIPGLMRKVDEATRAETSGNFYNFDGQPMSY